MAAGAVVDAPHSDDPAGHMQAPKAVPIEALVAEAAIQAIDKGGLDRLALRDIVPVDATILTSVCLLP